MNVISEFKNLQGLEVHIRVYNPGAKETVVCWHGLARCAFDFDYIARQLASNNLRVICPDTPGRGLSQWLDDTSEHQYGFGLYVSLARALLDAYEIKQTRWVGTSMGGLLGILMTSDEINTKITSLVINDIGPEIPADALEHIVQYVGQDIPEFSRFTEYVDYVSDLYSTMGERTNSEWIEFAKASMRRTDQGKYTVHYDTNIVGQFDPSAPAVDLWPQYQAINCPVMIVQGKLTDVLPDAVFRKMQELKPEAKTLIIDGCAHPPGLHNSEQALSVINFVLENY